MQSALILFSVGDTQTWLRTDDPHMDGYLVLVCSSKGDGQELHILDPDTLTSTWTYTIEGDITIQEEEKDGLPFVWWTSTSVRKGVFPQLDVKLIDALPRL